jgi:hypothetical protein
VRPDRAVPEYNKRPNIWSSVYRTSLQVSTVTVFVSTCRETCNVYVNIMLRPVTLGLQIYVKMYKNKI